MKREFIAIHKNLILQKIVIWIEKILENLSRDAQIREVIIKQEIDEENKYVR